MPILRPVGGVAGGQTAAMQSPVSRYSIAPVGHVQSSPRNLGRVAPLMGGLEAGANVQGSDDGSLALSTLANTGIAAGTGFAYGGPLGALLGGGSALLLGGLSAWQQSRAQKKQKREMKRLQEEQMRLARQDAIFQRGMMESQDARAERGMQLQEKDFALRSRWQNSNGMYNRVLAAISEDERLRDKFLSKGIL